MILRLFATLLVLFASLFSFPARIYADSGDCNQFESIQSIILSEATRQPFSAQLEIARVAVTHGACERDANFYSGLRIADNILRLSPTQCIENIHCRAYYLLHTIDPSIREPAALAAHISLTEQPRIQRFHFDSWGSTAKWWDSLSACPHGWFIVSLTKVC